LVYTVSTVVSIRIDDETVEDIEKMGYKPSEYLSMILENQMRLERRRRSLEWFRKNLFESDGTTGAEMIRKDRDSR